MNPCMDQGFIHSSNESCLRHVFQVPVQLGRNMAREFSTHGMAQASLYLHISLFIWTLYLQLLYIYLCVLYQYLMLALTIFMFTLNTFLNEQTNQVYLFRSHIIPHCGWSQGNPITLYWHRASNVRLHWEICYNGNNYYYNWLNAITKSVIQRIKKCRYPYTGWKKQENHNKKVLECSMELFTTNVEQHISKNIVNVRLKERAIGIYLY